MEKSINSGLKIRNIFFIASVCLVILAVFSFLRIQSLEESARIVKHTNSVRLELERSLSYLKHAESNQRAYLLTKDPAFYAEYTAGIKSFHTQIVKVESLTADNKFQEANLNALRSLSDKWIGQLESAMADPVKTSQLIQEGRLLNETELTISQMMHEENRLLNLRSGVLSRNIQITPILTILLIFFSLAVLLLAYLRVNKSLKRSLQLSNELQVQHDILKDNELRYHLMVEEVTDYAIILLNEKGDVLNWNKGAQKIKGYTTEEILGKNFSTFYTEEDKLKGLPQRLIGEAAEKGRALHEGWRLRKDGSRFWGSIAITALHNPKGDVIGYTKVTRDLTDLKVSEERYHRMVEEVTDYAIILLNNEGNIENWNKGAQKIKGYEASEIIGKNFSIFYTEPDLKSNLPLKLINQAREEGRAMHEGWRVRKDGTHFWGSVALTALHNNNGEIFGFTKVTRDLTERRMAEEDIKRNAEILEKKNMELQRMNKELQSFAYISSHDLQEPLRKIQTFSDRILELEGDKLSEKGGDYFRRSREAAKRMQILIEDLLEYAHTNSNEGMFERTEMGLIVENVKQGLKEIIDSKEARVECPSDCVLNIIPFQFQQLMHNLISNALKFSKPGITPVIKISCNICPAREIKNVDLDNTLNYAHIQVQDNGIGFNEEYNEKIFEIFQRLHGKAEYKGTGIGLAICKKIVENHGGIIKAHGRENEGAMFDIFIPVI